jgi:hypothetical protein
MLGKITELEELLLNKYKPCRTDIPGNGTGIT